MIHGKGVANPSFRQRTAYHATLLGGMAMITSALIVIGNKQTYADIELRRAEDMKRSISQVIHPDMYTNDLLQDVIHLTVNSETKDVYVARSEEKVIGVAFEMTSQGYAGPIAVMVGINRKGELLGVRVLSHAETPGLGDKIEPEKSPWIFGFDGLSLSNPGESQWKVKKDGGYFDQFTGATITPRAVIKAIKSALEFFKANQAVLLAETKPQQNAQPAGGSNNEADTRKPPKSSSDAEQKMKPEDQQTEIQSGATERGKSSG